MTDIEIINGIKAYGRERELALAFIYKNNKYRKPVAAKIQQRNGSKADFDAVFQETVVAFDRNLRLDAFKGESTLCTYFLNIAFRRLEDYWRRTYPRALVEDKGAEAPAKSRIAGDEILLANRAYSEEITIILEDNEVRTLLDEAIGKLSQRDREIILHNLKGYSMQEIAALFDIQPEKRAKRVVFDIRQRLKKIIESNAALSQRYREIKGI